MQSEADMPRLNTAPGQFPVPLVEVKDLRKHFPISSGLFSETKSYVRAVDGVSFNIYEGQSLALVGESGSGKTTTGKMLVRLLDPTSGSIQMNLDGNIVDLAQLRQRELKGYRQNVQMIFQDPYESLNPRRTIYDTVAEPLQVQGIGNVAEREMQVARILTRVGLAPADTFMFRFPHELSGGQRQRVAIARALIVLPTFVVADEPTSMLDVSIRTSIMNLMRELSEMLGITYLYITHDLAVARYMVQRIAVMYKGKIVELGETEEILQDPRHPYTRALLSAVPLPDPTIRRGRAAARDVVWETCPDRGLEEVSPGHWVACYLEK